MADNDQVGAGQSVGRFGEDAPKEEQTPENAKLERRRKFLIGGLSAAPVIATLTSRPAWAGNNCPYSDALSTHASEPPADCAADNLESWQTASPVQIDQYFNVGPCNPLSGGDPSFCTDYSIPTIDELRAAFNAGQISRNEAAAYMQELQDNPPTLFANVFLTDPPPPSEHNATMMECLMGGSLGGECVAAYCNAHYYGVKEFGYSPSDIVQIVNNGLQTDPDELRRMLWYKNNNLQGPHPWG